MEHQNIEYKESWRDEYIKWICGFANANGGTLIIGKSDKGAVVGVPDAKNILETLPNKIRDILGIIVDVNFKIEKGKELIEIKVDYYPYPISYKGEYHYRTGSTKQELKGAALDQFLLKKQGKRWDSVPIPNVTSKELKKDAFQYFRNQANKSGRVSKDILSDSNKQLLENLRLFDGKYLKRSALLLFHPDPEKYFTNAFIKIGYFENDADIIYQDEIHGNLFEQTERVIDLLLTKYLKAIIHYEGITRIEKYPLPEAALREAILNAIVHKDYSKQVPIQISVYPDKLIIWNAGELPEHWTINTLKQKHPSIPFNPDLANAFFRAGLIEAWGRGIEKIRLECKTQRLPLPEFKYESSGFFIEFKTKWRKSSPESSPESSPKTKELVLTAIQNNPHITSEEIGRKLGLTKRAILKNIDSLKKNGFLERIGSQKSGHWKIKKEILTK